MSDTIQGLILGAVQGITEWLPISSEGINTLISTHFFGEPADEAIEFAIWLHLGTALAAAVYFRKDLKSLLRHLPQYLRDRGASGRSERNPVITYLIVATVLTGALGAPLLLFGLDETEIQGAVLTAIVGGFLIAGGLLQRLARRYGGTRTTPSLVDSAVLGVVQAFSVFPGISRSGLTASALLLRGYDAGQAVRLSFLMSIPLVLAAGVGLGLIRGPSFDPVALISLVPAFVLGLLTIGVLVRIARQVAFWKFCLVIGALSFLPLLLDRLT